MIRIGDKVSFGTNNDWVVTDVLKYDHSNGGAPKVLQLRRTLVIDAKRRYLDEAECRTVTASEVTPSP